MSTYDASATLGRMKYGSDVKTKSPFGDAGDKPQMRYGLFAYSKASHLSPPFHPHVLQEYP